MTATVPVNASGRDEQPLREYRVVAHCVDNAHPGATYFTSHVMAGSVEEAVRKIRRTSRGSSLFSTGLYRIVRVEEARLDREAAEVHRLRAFARYCIATTPANTMARRRILELTGEANDLCNASTIESSSGDWIVCTREIGHYDPQQPPDETGPGGWHHCNTSVWDDSTPCSRPHSRA
ncbi:hypothetical protein CTZ27_29975 [Streptomyces griseocarneus]|nr:hypothetical protein CTZ27_29975 [Streptomyces griseocarneus]